MKKIYSLLTAIFVFTSVFSQKLEKENVPAPVMKAFESTYSIPKNVKWELDFENYQVEFMEGKIGKTVWYNKEGKWLKKYTMLLSTELPTNVKDTLTKELGGTFAGYSYDYIEKREEQGKESIYKIIVIKNKFPQEFYISESGKLQEKEAEEN